jgi:hypothetical protein
MEDVTAKVKEAEKYLARPPYLWDYPKVMVAMPQERSLSNPSIVARWIAKMGQEGFTFAWRGYERTDRARNEFALSLLKNEQYTHIIMVDNDHNHPLDLLRKLARWALVGDYKVVASLAFQRGMPYKPVHYLADGDDYKIPTPDSWSGGLEEVSMTGAGAIMIHRDVFMELEMPFFFYDYSLAWEGIYPGEEIGFCKKCREAEIKMWVDTSIYTPHLSVKEIGPEDYAEHYGKYGLMSENEVKEYEGSRG